VFKRLILLFMCTGTMYSQVVLAGIFKEGDQVLIQTSLLTAHYDPEPDHNNHQKLINLEWYFPATNVDALPRPSGRDWRDEVQWLIGGASFLNSFDQRTTYLYTGGRYNFHDSGDLKTYGKLTAGLIHGYRGEYRDKIPFNRFGVAPAILPAFGVEYNRMNLEMIPFGTAGFMVNVGYYFR
jgi:hypothetical protein